jgi:hypothetical protein
MKRIICLFMVISLLTATCPFLYAAVVANPTAPADICDKARADSQLDNAVGSLTWMGVGCLFPLITVIVSLLVSPTVPPLRIAGKASSYVESYSPCYIDAIKNQQFLSSVLGCSLGISLSFAIFELISLLQ